MWIPVFACACGCRVAPDEQGRLTCGGCGTGIAKDHGIFRCLTEERLAQVEPFLAQYRAVRERDGYRTDRPGYYRSLPCADPGDPQSPIWRIRRRSFQRLHRQVLSMCAGRALAVLDLGAGSGWLSYRLTKAGCRAVAVDLLADDRDGLGAFRHYDALFACVQADFDVLPFVPHQFDVVVFNGSLHYSPDVAATLRHGRHMLAPGGALVVVDSPVFAEESAGASMRARNRARLRADYGVAAPIEPGEGFLTFGRLKTCAAAMDLSQRFFTSNADLRQALSGVVARVTGRVRAPRFGVWVARPLRTRDAR